MVRTPILSSFQYPGSRVSSGLFQKLGSDYFNDGGGSPQHPALAQGGKGPGDEPTPESTNREALMRLLGFGLGTAGIGAAARGIAAIPDMLDPAGSGALPAGGLRPTVMRVAVPRLINGDDTTRKRRSSLLKFSEEKGWGNWLAGNTHTNYLDKPWFMPAMLAAGSGGLYGGWKLTDKLLDQRRKAESDEALDTAKKHYRKALLEQYSSDTPGIKTGEAADSLAVDLDKLYTLTKQSGFLNDAAGRGTGAYLTLAGLLAGGAGLGTYNYAKARSPEERLAKAIKQREKLRWATRPPEIYAVSSPTNVRVSPFGAKDEEEGADETTPSAKIAAAQQETAQIAAMYKP